MRSVYSAYWFLVVVVMTLGLATMGCDDPRDDYAVHSTLRQTDGQEAHAALYFTCNLRGVQLMMTTDAAEANAFCEAKRKESPSK